MGKQQQERQCPNGFIVDYTRYTRLHGAPECFHWWAAASLVAAALGRRVFIDLWMFRTIPNLFTLLVAPTGLCHGTTVIEKAFGLFAKALPLWAFKLCGQKATIEALIKMIEHYDAERRTGRTEDGSGA